MNGVIILAPPTVNERRLYQITISQSSSEVTAGILRYRLTGMTVFETSPERLTPEFIGRTPLFQILFRNDIDDDHTLTVYNGKIHQSFYGKEWDVRPFHIPKHITPILNRISARELGVLTGVKFNSECDYVILVPPVKKIVPEEYYALGL